MARAIHYSRVTSGEPLDANARAMTSAVNIRCHGRAPKADNASSIAATVAGFGGCREAAQVFGVSRFSAGNQAPRLWPLALPGRGVSRPAASGFLVTPDPGVWWAFSWYVQRREVDSPEPSGRRHGPLPVRLECFACRRPKAGMCRMALLADVVPNASALAASSLIAKSGKIRPGARSSR